MNDDRRAVRWPRGQPVGLATGSAGRSSARQSPSLTAHDMQRLTLYKWRYALESAGFTADQAARLMFLRWLHARQGVGR